MTRRYLTFALSISMLVFALASARAQEPEQPAAEPPPAAEERPTLVRKVVHRPRRHRTVVRRFTPWAAPTPAQARTIAALEAGRYNVSLGVLSCRIFRESGWRWNASNGSYNGLGQFHPSTFARGVSTLGDRRVRIITRSSRVRRTRVAWVYSDGSVKRGLGRRVRARTTVVRRGRIPRNPPYLHGWAQVRIMAQALAGRSAVHSGEWSTKSYCG